MASMFNIIIYTCICLRNKTHRGFINIFNSRAIILVSTGGQKVWSELRKTFLLVVKPDWKNPSQSRSICPVPSPRETLQWDMCVYAKNLNVMTIYKTQKVWIMKFGQSNVHLLFKQTFTV